MRIMIISESGKINSNIKKTRRKMKEVKTFWAVSPSENQAPDKVEVMSIDGKQELYRYVYDNDEKSSWNELDECTSVFYEDEEEAKKVVNERVLKIWEAVKTLYHTGDDISGALKNISKGDTDEGRWWKAMEEGDDDTYSECTIMSYMKNVARFMEGKPMSCGAVSFRLKDIVYVESCNDRTNEKKFYRVMLTSGEKYAVYEKDDMKVLKAVFGIDGGREYVRNGSLDYLND